MVVIELVLIGLVLGNIYKVLIFFLQAITSCHTYKYNTFLFGFKALRQKKFDILAYWKIGALLPLTSYL